MLIHHKFQELLRKRKEAGTFRSLKPQADGIDFYSNDYLGLARNKDFRNILLQAINDHPELISGSTGSRLISGNTGIAAATEEYIAKKHGFADALLFPSGYNANLALFSTLLTRHDTIIVDEQIHRSVHDGCKMSHARKLKFRHNDLEDLEKVLKRQKGQCYIAIESLYSMDGDLPPIEDIVILAQQYNAGILVDEAHAFGVLGYGLVEQYQLQDKVLAVLVTYGKALGVHGAAILCNEMVKSYLINFATPFIYTTSAQDFQWVSIKSGYEFLKNHQELPKKLRDNIDLFKKQGLKTPSSSKSPVQAIIIPDNQKLKTMQNILLKENFLTYAVYSPTLKEGTERLRICLHSFNTEDEIIRLAEIMKQYLN